METKVRLPELLAPAGSMRALEAAVCAGIVVVGGTGTGQDLYVGHIVAGEGNRNKSTAYGRYAIMG